MTCRRQKAVSRIELTGINKQLLNLAGAKSGMDFGSTTISSTNEVELAKGGSVITARGQLDVSKLQLTRMNQTTPQLDLRGDYNVTVDRAQSTALLRALTLNGTQNGSPMLKAELTSPMQIGWANTNNAVGNSSLTLAVTSSEPGRLETVPRPSGARRSGEHDGEGSLATRAASR